MQIIYVVHIDYGAIFIHCGEEKGLGKKLYQTLCSENLQKGKCSCSAFFLCDTPHKYLVHIVLSVFEKLKNANKIKIKQKLYIFFEGGNRAKRAHEYF